MLTRQPSTTGIRSIPQTENESFSTGTLNASVGFNGAWGRVSLLQGCHQMLAGRTMPAKGPPGCHFWAASQMGRTAKALTPPRLSSLGGTPGAGIPCSFSSRTHCGAFPSCLAAGVRDAKGGPEPRALRALRPVPPWTCPPALGPLPRLPRLCGRSKMLNMSLAPGNVGAGLPALGAKHLQPAPEGQGWGGGWGSTLLGLASAILPQTPNPPSRCPVASLLSQVFS